MHVTETDKCYEILNISSHIKESCDERFFQIEKNHFSKLLFRSRVDKEIKRIFQIVTDETARQAIKEAFDSAPLTKKISYPHDPVYGSFYKPTVKGLAYICLEYQEKYGTQIWVSSRRTPLASLIDRAEKEALGHFGAIVCHQFNDGEEKNLGHVTPVLFLKNRMNKRWDILVNDSIADKNNAMSFPLTKLALSMDFRADKIYFNRQERQIDSHSCRIDAVVTLRNLLLQSRDKNTMNVMDLFSGRLPDYEIDRFTLPFILSADAYASQFPIDDAVRQDIVVRDKYSKAAGKRVHPRTVESMRRMYEKKVHKVNRYKFHPNDEDEFLEEYTLDRLSHCNLYLQYKAAHLFLKVMYKPDKYTEEELQTRVISKTSRRV